MQKKIFIALFLILLSSLAFSQEEPSLPKGLSVEEKMEEPSLPEGLFATPSYEETKKIEKFPFSLSGFLESRLGTRVLHDTNEKDLSIGEIRFQVEIEKHVRNTIFKLTTDMLYDPVLDHHHIELETGKGWLDLRNAYIIISPFSFLDVKVGRQILTWGTGDMIFINDLFPKDWNSFFIGRDPEYLKAPEDAIKFSFYTSFANFDLVYTPYFSSDRYIDGRRISYFSPFLQKRVGRNFPLYVKKPSRWFRDDEIATRIFKNIKGYEFAIYNYFGFWKSPAGFLPKKRQAKFPDLFVYGGSVRGVVFGGIGNLEFGYYDSRDDISGKDPFLKNSEYRFLLGYEREISKDFTGSFQYYLEYMRHYGRYKESLPPNVKKRDRDRHLVTVRLTKLLMNQNLSLSFFTYFSPTDKDCYMRPRIHYKYSDHISFDLGANVFFGAHKYTFFSQFERNTNIYFAFRYSFTKG